MHPLLPHITIHDKTDRNPSSHLKSPLVTHPNTEYNTTTVSVTIHHERPPEILNLTSLHFGSSNMQTYANGIPTGRAPSHPIHRYRYLHPHNHLIANANLPFRACLIIELIKSIRHVQLQLDCRPRESALLTSDLLSMAQEVLRFLEKATSRKCWILSKMFL